MTAYIPTNSFGGTIGIDADAIKEDIIVQTDKKYLNEIGDSMRGNIGMNNFIIKDSGDPVDPKDVVNKAYLNTFADTAIYPRVDTSIQTAIEKDVRPLIIKATDQVHTLISNIATSVDEEFKKHKTQITTFKNSIQTDIHTALTDCKKKVDNEIIILKEKTNTKHKELSSHVASILSKVSILSTSNIVVLSTILEKEKRKAYHSILDKYKPKFWLSAMFPYGFAEKQNFEPWAMKDLCENGINIYNTPILKMDADHHIGIYLGTDVRIKSSFSFTDTFSFFILCRKANKNDVGRFITGIWGNIVVGFWGKNKDVVHINEFLVRGSETTNNELYFFYIRSERKLKYVYLSNVFDDIHIMHLKEGIFPNFKQVVIGQPITFTKESMAGWIYECICFDNFIEDPKEIVSFIKKYY